MPKYHVTWFEEYDGIENKNTSVCFSDMWEKDVPPNSMRYLCNVDKALQQKEIIFYIKFLEEILDKSLFTYSIQTKEDAKIVEYKLKTKNLTRAKTLMYLTAFRYLDEYPGIVKEFYKNKTNKITDLNELWKDFYFIHYRFDHYTNYNFKGHNLQIKMRKWDNLSGHGLISQYNWCDKSAEFILPISLTKFKKNINESFCTVREFFTKNA